jgi:hypothetical protein
MTTILVQRLCRIALDQSLQSDFSEKLKQNSKIFEGLIWDLGGNELAKIRGLKLSMSF